MTYIKKIDGTSSTNFNIGLSTSQVGFRSNSGITEVVDNGGTFKRIGKAFKAPESFTVDSTIASNGIITLSSTPEPNSEFVTLNGVPMIRNIDYTITGATITMNHSGDDLIVSDVITVIYQ